MSTTQDRLTEIETQEKKLADEKAKLLKASKKDDLELVRKLCKQHGFTATNLRGCLVGRGKKAKGEEAGTKAAAKKVAGKKRAAKKTTARKTAGRKTTARKTAGRKTAKSK
jgi:hypothetical protein